MNSILSGYGGMASTEALTYHDGLSIYFMTDSSKSTLVVIPLTPGFLYEAFRIVKMSSYIDIIIVIPCIDQYMVSDLINLVRLSILQKGANHVRWINPDDLSEWNTDIMKETHIKNSSFFLDQIFDNRYYAEILIEFIPNHISRTAGNVYDILLWDGKKQRYFINYVKILKLNDLCKDIRIQEIHLPWKPVWGGISGFEIISGIAEKAVASSDILLEDFYSSNRDLSTMTYEELKDYSHEGVEKVLVAKKVKAMSNIKQSTKLRFHSFPSDSIYTDFRNKFGIKLGEVIWNALI